TCLRCRSPRARRKPLNELTQQRSVATVLEEIPGNLIRGRRRRRRRKLRRRSARYRWGRRRCQCRQFLRCRVMMRAVRKLLQEVAQLADIAAVLDLLPGGVV